MTAKLGAVPQNKALKPEFQWDDPLHFDEQAEFGEGVFAQPVGVQDLDESKFARPAELTFNHLDAAASDGGTVTARGFLTTRDLDGENDTESHFLVFASDFEFGGEVGDFVTEEFGSRAHGAAGAIGGAEAEGNAEDVFVREAVVHSGAVGKGIEADEGLGGGV